MVFCFQKIYNNNKQSQLNRHQEAYIAIRTNNLYPPEMQGQAGETKLKTKTIFLCPTSLVAQWIKICLPMPGTQARSPTGEDPTCCGIAKPRHHNYWVCAPESVSCN